MYAMYLEGTEGMYVPRRYVCMYVCFVYFIIYININKYKYECMNV